MTRQRFGLNAAIAAVIVTVVVLGRFFLPGPWHETAPAEPAIPATDHFYLGVDTSRSTLAAYEAAAGTEPTIFGVYTSGRDGQIAYSLSEAAKVPGTVPLVSWGVDLTDGKVASGSQDTYLAAQAKAVAAYGKPVLLRLDWEMNGSWYPQWGSAALTPSAYIAAWRHIWTIFHQQGATNAAFVWCPNVGDLGGHPWTDWYPGNPYVDWIGLDAYPDPTDADADVSGPGGLDAVATFAARADKPAMLAEWAPGNPDQNPEQTFDLVFAWADRYPSTVKALVYFNYTGTQRDDLLVDDPAGAALYRSLVSEHKSRLYSGS